MTKVTTTSATTATELKEFAKRAKGANEFKFTKDGVKRPIYDLVKNIDVVAGVSGTVEFLKLKRKVMGNGKRGRIESQEPVELTEIDPIKKEEISDAAKYVKEFYLRGKGLEKFDEGNDNSPLQGWVTAGEEMGMELDDIEYSEWETEIENELNGCLACAAEELGIDTEVLRSRILAQLGSGPKRAIQNKSTASGPVALVWEICERETEANPEVRRKDLIAICEASGIAFYTARTQIQAWRKAGKA
jgi:hypothetical protein|tara:strand:+ start:1552 stop:2289 length:738 start_codon:yes stop_codon:yes gene_type:complete